MTEVTESDLESVEAENENKRAVLAALKAHEAALLIGNVFDDRSNALAEEGRLLDAQIENQLEVLAGHAGLPSTDLDAAKATMLAAVQKQVANATEAAKKAAADAKTSVDTEANAAALEVENDATGETSKGGDRLDTLLSVVAQSAPAVEPPTPGETSVPVAAVSPDLSTSQPPTPEVPTLNPPLPDPDVTVQTGATVKDGE